MMSELATPARQPRKAYDLEQTSRFLDYVLDPTTGCSEIRIPRAGWKKNIITKSEYQTTISGWFDDQDKITSAIQYCREVSLYITVNPVILDLMARENSNHLAQTRVSTSDNNISCLRWIYIDVDSSRVSDISSTEDELKYALDRRERVLDETPSLRESSIWGCSGNGAWILVAIPDLPNSEESKASIAQVLAVLAQQFSDDKAKIDPKTKNPSRIMCLPGTVKCKGISTSERPWRPVTIDSPPGGTLRPWDLAGFLAAQGGPVAVPVTRAERIVAAQVNGVDGGALAIRITNYMATADFSVSGNKGHDKAFKAACALVQGFALDPAAAYPYFAQFNLESCQPPWSEPELWHKLEDALGATNNGKPRGYILDPTRNNPEPEIVEQEIAAADNLPQLENKPRKLGVVESRDDPSRLARVFLTKEHRHKDGLTMRFWQGEYYTWNGCYKVALERDIRAHVQCSIKEEFDQINKDEIDAWVKEAPKKKEGKEKASPAPKALKVSSKLVGDAVLAVAGYSRLNSWTRQPSWIGSKAAPFPAENVVPTRNALVYLPGYVEGSTEAIHAPTPRYFCPYTLDYDFDASAPEPTRWLDFLWSLWSEDPESISTLQEWFGYFLTPDTSQHKILVMIGPKRSGKGTIARIIKALVGSESVANPTIAGLATNFGLAPLIGKPVAIITDARMSSRTDIAQVVERLLSISGEDSQTIDRKHQAAQTVKLPTRFVLISNELPRLADTSGALASRMVLLRMTESFYGKEDSGLTDKLMGELPGILLWAIEGWKRLHERGYFEQPESGRAMIDEIEDLSSPVGSFIKDRCTIEVGSEIQASILYAHWKLWCAERGRDNPGDELTFGKNLRAVLPRLNVCQHRLEDGTRKRFYEGIRVVEQSYDWSGGE